jgi:peptide-methionine (S)-S-oxide reductase
MNETATFAAGCFWGVENTFMSTEGVLKTRVGYIGGKVESPSYKMVCTGQTGHAEAVEVLYDPKMISYHQLLELFFQLHNPTQLNQQGPDIGTQYRSAIFYHNDTQKSVAKNFINDLIDKKVYPNKIATTLEPASTFWEAEEYHQKYILKNGGGGCLI